MPVDELGMARTSYEARPCLRRHGETRMLGLLGVPRGHTRRDEGASVSSVVLPSLYDGLNQADSETG